MLPLVCIVSNTTDTTQGLFMVDQVKHMVQVVLACVK